MHSVPRRFGFAVRGAYAFARWFRTLLSPLPSDQWPGLEAQRRWRDTTPIEDEDAVRRAVAMAREDHADALAAYDRLDQKLGASLQVVGIVAGILGASRAAFPAADDRWIAAAFFQLAISAAWIVVLRRSHRRRLMGPLPDYLAGLPADVSQREAWHARSLYVVAWRQRQFNDWLATRSVWATLPLAGAILALGIGATRVWFQSSSD